MAGNTRKYLSVFMESGIFNPNEELKQPDFVAMDGGRFYIGAQRKDDLIVGLADMLKKGNLDIGLVPVTPGNCIFFADIDDYEQDKFALDDFLVKVAGFFNHFVRNKPEDKDDWCTAEDILVFEKANPKAEFYGPKYHIYIPEMFGITTPVERATIYKTINIAMGQPIIDEAASTIRIEGFNKWCKEAKMFLPDSHYRPRGKAANMLPDDLLNAVWLQPRGWTTEVVPAFSPDRPRRLRRNEDDMKLESESLPSQTASIVSRSTSFILQNADNRAVSPEGDGASHKSVSAHIERTVQLKFPEVANLILKYPIVKIKDNAKDHVSTFICDKSTEGKTCKISNCVHSSNNIYLVYSKKYGKLEQRCFSSKCKTADGEPMSHLIATVSRKKKSNNNKNAAGLPYANDTSLAKCFKKWNPLITVDCDGKHTSFVMFEHDVGYWKRRSNSYFMKYIINDFKNYVAAEFRKAMEGVEDADLMDRADAVADRLSNTKTIKPFAECLKWELEPDEPIDWNNNPKYTVFTNGVLMWGERDPKHPKLPYKFGKTKPEEYISDFHCMRFPFNCPPVSMDGHYIREARQFLRKTLKKVQPNAEDRRLIIMYMSLCFQAQNYKKMVINIGSSGNNAKSSVFECLIYLCGTYGLTGDKKLVVKGPNDKVSVAELNRKRVVMFEEPDPAKPLDQEFLKDLIGGAHQTTGRMLFSNKNQILLHCKTILNANTMTTVALEAAILERLIYFIWEAKFTKNPDEVDHARRIYLADDKYKTARYWASVNDGMMWLLLNHFHLYALNGYTLKISKRQLARTKCQLLEADLFIKWFSSNFKLLTDSAPHRRQFVTQEEVVAEFVTQTPTQQQNIIGRRNYAPRKFVRDMLKVHSALTPYFVKKYTNWRLSQIERLLPAAKNRIGPNCQYQRNVLIRFVTRGEAEGRFKDHTMDLAEVEAKTEEEAKCDVKDDYIYDESLFFLYGDPAQCTDDIDLESDEEPAVAPAANEDENELLNEDELLLNDDNFDAMVDYVHPVNVENAANANDDPLNDIANYVYYSPKKDQQEKPYPPGAGPSPDKDVNVKDQQSQPLPKGARKPVNDAIEEDVDILPKEQQKEDAVSLIQAMSLDNSPIKQQPATDLAANDDNGNESKDADNDAVSMDADVLAQGAAKDGIAECVNDEDGLKVASADAAAKDKAAAMVKAIAKEKVVGIDIGGDEAKESNDNDNDNDDDKAVSGAKDNDAQKGKDVVMKDKAEDAVGSNAKGKSKPTHPYDLRSRRKMGLTPAEKAGKAGNPIKRKRNK